MGERKTVVEFPLTRPKDNIICLFILIGSLLHLNQTSIFCNSLFSLINSF